MSEIEDPRHQSYVKYPLADTLIKDVGIEKIPSKATFAKILSMIDGKEIGKAIIDVLQSQFGTAGAVVAVDGKSICSTSVTPARPGLV